VTTLHRHLFKEVFAAVTLSTGGFLFVMVVGNLVKEYLPRVVAGQLPWVDFFKIMVMLIPGVAPYVLPVGMLTGVLLVLGRMSAQNEITAMKASGISLARIAAPIVALGVAGTLLATAVNFEYSPRMTAMVKAMIFGKVRGGNFVDYVPVKTAYPLPSSDNASRLTLYASAKDGGTLRDVWLWRTDASGEDYELDRAESASVVFDAGNPDDPADDRMRVALSQVRIERRETKGEGIPTVRIGYAETLESPDLKVDSLFKDEVRAKKLSWCTFSELMAMRDGSGAAKSDAEARFAERIRVQFQIQSYLANAFGILSLTLLAIPLGIRVARSETFVNMAVALGLAIAYYFAMVSFQWIRDPHLRPDILVWIPNLAVQALACRLFFKASRT